MIKKLGIMEQEHTWGGKKASELKLNEAKREWKIYNKK